MTAIDVIEGRARWTVLEGDCITLMQALPDACVDAVVTDPPAGIAFMSKGWDHDRGGRAQWIAWLAERMAEALRVLKPGGHALVWALPRTSHWTGTALEDAGFEVRDRVAHVVGSGFPKSVNVSKAIDKLAGAEREVIGPGARHGGGLNLIYGEGMGDGAKPPITAPATEDAKRWDGWGTALKPAVEDWWLVRKPIRGSIARNVLEYGTGALNIDGCRVPHASAADLAQHAAGVDAIKARGGVIAGNVPFNTSDLSGASDVSAAGRWPAHLLLSHAEGCERAGTRKVKAAPPWNDNRSPSLFSGEATSAVHHTDGDGFETVDAWACVDGCPVKLLDEQSGNCPSGSGSKNNRVNASWEGGAFKPQDGPTGGDDGGASRYFTTFPPAKETAWESADRSRCALTDATSPARDTCEASSTDAIDSSTASSGKNTTDRSPKDSRSTTSTKTSKITGSKISPSWTPPHTSDCTADASCATEHGGSRANAATPSSQSTPDTGIYPAKAIPYTDAAEDATSALCAKKVEDVPPFFYTAKASRSDRENGCDFMPRKTGGEATGRKDGSAGLNSPRAGAGRGGGRTNIHPCTKSTDLMRWLVRLICPPGGVVLDPFAGSGSTGVACSAERMRFIGFELDPEYAAIARARIVGDAPLLNTQGGL
jgi:hypothetical protein